MELLSVIRRWHYRDHFSIREISRRTGLSRNTVRSTCARTARSRSSASLIGRASWTHTLTNCRTCCDKRRGSRASGSGRSSRCTPTWWCWAMRARTIAWRPLHVIGGQPGSESRNRRPWRFRTPGVHGRRSLPIRLVRGLGGHCRRANQAAGRSLQTVLQPRLLPPGLPAADPRDAVRRS
jgi:hypothetical protein